MRHFAEHDMQKLVDGRLSQGAMQRVVKHLASGCPACSARLGAALQSARHRAVAEAGDSEDYDVCLDRIEARLPQLTAAWAEESRRREKGLALVHARGWGNLTVAQRRIYRGRWAEVEMLLDLSFERRYRDPQGMLQLALRAQAVAAAPQLCADYPEKLVFDLRARAAAEVANAERVNERFVRAEEALALARDLLEQGTEDLAIGARIDELQASLFKDLRYQDPRRLGQAEALLDKVHGTFIKLGDRHLAGRALVGKATCRFYAGEPLATVAILRQAIPLLDSARDPLLVSAAQHNLLDALVDAGQVSEARRLLMKSGLGQAFSKEPLNLLRLRWIDAKLLAVRNKFEDAVNALTAVRDELRRHGLEVDSAIAGVDLAKVYLQQSRHQELHALSQELLARARAKGIHHNAQEALHCFEILCRVGQATVPGAERLKRFLEEAERRPGLCFEPELLVVG
jgi:hypothetical protein